MMSGSQFRFDSEDLGLLQSVLNEVLNGFKVPDFDQRIGMNRGEAEELFKRIRSLHCGDSLTLGLHEARAFRNALSETIKELGPEEFHTRTGYTLSHGNASLNRLDGLFQDRRA
jgi:hypothetical protein